METLTVQETPHNLIALAIEKGLDTQSLKELMDLKERYDAGLARKEFFRAFTEFQAHCPDLRKTKAVEFGNTKYTYAPLADIARQIGKVLKDNALSYRWEIKDDGETMNVSCLVSHVDGHTETTTMSAKADTSGSKNPIQARGSAIEYLKRYTLIGALGISTADSDIDGRLPADQVDINHLHAEYMKVYSQIIQLDSSKTNLDPDNWKVERTPKLYLRATGEIRKILFDLQQKVKK